LLRPAGRVSLVLLFSVLVSCALNPVTGQQEIALISEQQEIEIGRNADPDILERYGYYPDSVLQGYVRRIGESLARVSDRPGIFYHFKVLDSPVENAFALPGGYIYVTRGILASLNSEAELAGVLGHEIGHVSARHAVQQLTAVFGLQLTSMILSRTVQGGESFSRITRFLLSGIMKGYGRTKEFQADRLGQNYMFRAGYDPYAAVEFLAALQRTEKNPLDPVTHWLVSTHPYTAERIQRAETHARELDPDHRTQLENRDRYYRKIDGLVYGAGVRDGVFRRGRYQNRYFRFSCRIPQGWKLKLGRDGWTAESPDRLLGLNLRFVQLGNILDAESFAVMMEKKAGLRPGVLYDRRERSGFRAVLIRYSIRGKTGPVRLYGVYLVRGKIGAALLGTAQSGFSSRLEQDVRFVFDSIRTLSVSEARQVPVLRIRIHKVRAGDSLRSLAERYLGDPSKGKKLAEMNEMLPGQVLVPGTEIKVIAY